MYAKILGKRRALFLGTASLVLGLLFVLSACGNAISATSANSASATLTPGQTGAQMTPTGTSVAATSTPTATSKQTGTYNCPNNTVMTTSPSAATVTLSASGSRTANLATGNTLEINLPFSSTWSGPLNFASNSLEMQTPAGYALPAAKACVWRFVAQHAGTTTLSFSGRPYCAKGLKCPMYIITLQFIVNIT